MDQYAYRRMGEDKRGETFTSSNGVGDNNNNNSEHQYNERQSTVECTSTQIKAHRSQKIEVSGTSYTHERTLSERKFPTKCWQRLLHIYEASFWTHIRANFHSRLSPSLPPASPARLPRILVPFLLLFHSFQCYVRTIPFKKTFERWVLSNVLNLSNTI